MRLIAQINREMEALESRRDIFSKQIAARSAKLARIMRLERLDSVGAFIEPLTGLILTQDAAGDPILDNDQAVHLDDASDEWFDALSDMDTIMVARVAFAIRKKAS